MGWRWRLAVEKATGKAGTLVTGVVGRDTFVAGALEAATVSRGAGGLLMADLRSSSLPSSRSRASSSNLSCFNRRFSPHARPASLYAKEASPGEFSPQQQASLYVQQAVHGQRRSKTFQSIESLPLPKYSQVCEPEMMETPWK